MNSKTICAVVSREKIIFPEKFLFLQWRRYRRNILIDYYYHQINFYSMTPKMFASEPWLNEYNNFQFFRLFRMEKNTFYQYVDIIGRTDINKVLQKPYKGGHHPVNISGHCLIFLWFIATQDTLLSIGTRFKVSPTTVMHIVNRMLYFTLKLKNQYIRFPNCEQELMDISEGFSNYPGAVGALDGTHIFVKVEKEQQDSYIDRYRRHSINLMAICDSNTLFTYVFVGFPGSAHDSRVFENSNLFRNIEIYGAAKYFVDDKKYHLIGDSAFTLRPWLMTPYRGDNLTRIQKNHNYKLSSERVKIEHCFGNLKGRWRRLQFINTYNICKSIEIVTAACVLHNYCIISKDLWAEEYQEEHALNLNNARGGQENQIARLKRDMIANDLYNNR